MRAPFHSEGTTPDCKELLMIAVRGFGHNVCGINQKASWNVVKANGFTRFQSTQLRSHISLRHFSKIEIRVVARRSGTGPKTTGSPNRLQQLGHRRRKVLVDGISNPIFIKVKVPLIEMFGDAALLSPGKTFYHSPESFVIVPTLINKAPIIGHLCLFYSVRHTIYVASGNHILFTNLPIGCLV